jgi:hypothetical protein
METPNLAKGYLYPSQRVARCPRCHLCAISHKCQNFDQHNLECAVCESRSPMGQDKLGGIIPEGEFVPDLQDAIHTVEQMMGNPMTHPDQEGQTIKPYDISSNYDKVKKSTELLSKFLNRPDTTMDEQIMEAMVDEETKKLLGRME